MPIIDKGKSVLIGNPIVQPAPRKIYSIIIDIDQLTFGNPATLRTTLLNTTGTTFSLANTIGPSTPFDIVFDDPSFLASHTFTISVITDNYLSPAEYGFDEFNGIITFNKGTQISFYITIEFLEI